MIALVFFFIIQFKEMGGSRRPSEPVKANEQTQERKKGFGDWMNLIKPANEEKDHWVKIKCNLFGFCVIVSLPVLKIGF